MNDRDSSLSSPLLTDLNGDIDGIVVVELASDEIRIEAKKHLVFVSATSAREHNAGQTREIPPNVRYRVLGAHGGQ